MNRVQDLKEAITDLVGSLRNAVTALDDVLTLALLENEETETATVKTIKTTKTTKPEVEEDETSDTEETWEEDETEDDEEEETETKTKGPTLSDVITSFRAYAKAKGRDKAAKVLAKHNVKSVQDLPKDKYKKVLAEIRV